MRSDTICAGRIAQPGERAEVWRFRQVLGAVALGLLLRWSACCVAAEAWHDIRQAGAVGDGKTLCTAAIQKTVDVCAESGGTVYVPAGVWLSGTIDLRSNVTLWLDAGATILGSPRVEDYPQRRPAVRSYTDNYVCQALLSGENLHHVAIRGSGTIDGNGAHFRWKEYRNRPYVIRLVACSDILVENVQLRNSPMWMQHYLACDRVALRGVRVTNHVSYNNDGLDIDGCRDVTISDCMFNSDDDALCLKSTLDRPCENVAINNCVLSSHCNALKMGTESNGGFQNITIANCTISSVRGSDPLYGHARGLAGIALEIVDGGHMENVVVNNLAIRGVTTPIFIRLGHRARPFTPDGPKPAVGTLRNVSISNVVASGVSNMPCSITGLLDHPVENVRLSNIQIITDGGGRREDCGVTVPEQEAKYPESKMFGTLPAYGFYCRHVRGLSLNGVRLATSQDDARYALVCDDVEDLTLADLDTPGQADAPSAVLLRQVRGAWVTGCRQRSAIGTFLKLEGKDSQRIRFGPSDLGLATRVVEAASDVPAGAWFVPQEPPP